MEEVFVPDPDAGPSADEEGAFFVEVRVPVQG
jgi:hypothetical protein